VDYIFSNTLLQVSSAFGLLKLLEKVSKKNICHCFPCLDD
jgi:hypothetical protein